jgi:hypothetical protein
MDMDEQIEEVRKTFSINKELSTKLELDAFWSRKSLRETLESILSDYYQNKDFDPYPKGYKKPKVGRKPQ